MSRRLVVLLVLSLATATLLAPTAAADNAIETFRDALPRRALAAEDDQVEVEPVPFDPEPPGGIHYTLYPFDDASGDGRRDTLLLSQEAGQSTRLDLLSGANLNDPPVWSRVLLQDYWYSYSSVRADYTEDGVRDLVFRTTGDYSNADTTVSAGGVTVGESSWNLPWVYEINDGVTGEKAFELEGNVGSGFLGGDASGPGVYLDAGQNTYGHESLSGTALPGGPGRALILGLTYEAPALWAYADAGAYIQASTTHATVDVDAFTGAGATDWSEELGSYPGDVSVERMDVTGDGARDLVLVWEIETADAWAEAADMGIETFLQPVTFLVEAFDVADGSKKWTAVEPPFVGFADSLSAGDANGDGAEDVLLVEFRFFPGAEGLSVTTAVVIWSGTDGAMLTKREYANMVHFPVPYGDLNGDGAEDFVAFEALVGPIDPAGDDPEFQDPKLLAETLDGEELWIRPAASFFEDLPDQENRHDFDGDGAADVWQFQNPSETFGDQTLVGPQEAPIVELVSGATGVALYAVAYEEDWDWPLAIPDITGDGGWDLAVVSRQDLDAPDADEDAPRQNYTVTVTVHRGVDFAVIWSRVLHTPADLPQGYALRYPNLELELGGDLDGNGAPDLLVSINPGCCTYFGEDTPESERPLDFSRVVVLDARDASIRWSLPAYPQEAPPPAPTAGPAYTGAPLPTDELAPKAKNSTPAIGLVAVLAALAVVALRRRH